MEYLLKLKIKVETNKVDTTNLILLIKQDSSILLQKLKRNKGRYKFAEIEYTFKKDVEDTVIDFMRTIGVTHLKEIKERIYEDTKVYIRWTFTKEKYEE